MGAEELAEVRDGEPDHAALLGEDQTLLDQAVAGRLERKPSSLSPARDGLIKKGLVFAEERGVVRITVPHFGQFLRTQRD